MKELEVVVSAINRAFKAGLFDINEAGSIISSVTQVSQIVQNATESGESAPSPKKGKDIKS